MISNLINIYLNFTGKPLYHIIILFDLLHDNLFHTPFCHMTILMQENRYMNIFLARHIY